MKLSMLSRVLLSATTLVLLSVFMALNHDDPSHPSGKPNAVRDVLHLSEIVYLNDTVGPESFAFDSDGRGPYTGVADGRILRWMGPELHGWADFATTSPHWSRERCGLNSEELCGRPLGLQFYRETGELYIADAYMGLMVVARGGGAATPLVAQAEGQPFRFTNSLDIDQVDGIVYFTDSSTQFQRREFPMLVASGDTTGRLLSYNPRTKEVKVLLKGLKFANGVALSRDRSFVLVAETSKFQITRFWLKGPDTGKTDLFAHVPGYPDNVKRNAAGEFWVALHGRRGPLSPFLQYDSWLKRAILKLPLDVGRLYKIFMKSKSYGLAFKLSEDGEILDAVEDKEGRSMRFLSEVAEINGSLWVDSVVMPFAGIYKL